MTFKVQLENWTFENCWLMKTWHVHIELKYKASPVASSNSAVVYVVGMNNGVSSPRGVCEQSSFIRMSSNGCHVCGIVFEERLKWCTFIFAEVLLFPAWIVRRHRPTVCICIWFVCVCVFSWTLFLHWPCEISSTVSLKINYWIPVMQPKE